MIQKQKRTELAKVFEDKKVPILKRKQAYEESRDLLLNPKKDFDPELFDPYDDDPDYAIKKRPRVEPPRIFPDMGMFPKEIMQGQLVGMYESKQDLYLMIAWLSRRVTKLEDQLGKKVDLPEKKS